MQERKRNLKPDWILNMELMTLYLDAFSSRFGQTALIMSL